VTETRPRCRVGAWMSMMFVVPFLLRFGVFSTPSRNNPSGRLAVAFETRFAADGLVSGMVRATVPGSKVFASTPVPASALARRFDQTG
jgi:hypothetical protein